MGNLPVLFGLSRPRLDPEFETNLGYTVTLGASRSKFVRVYLKQKTLSSMPLLNY